MTQSQFIDETSDHNQVIKKIHLCWRWARTRNDEHVVQKVLWFFLIVYHVAGETQHINWLLSLANSPPFILLQK